MTPFHVLSGKAHLLLRDNVDTDLIIPARHLKTLSRAGLGAHAFEAIRANAATSFDDPNFANAPILIAGANFGCGSSREHAAWALADLGIKAVIATSFSDIFAGNAFKNGIATVALPPESIAVLVESASNRITVDLEAKSVRDADGRSFVIEMDAFRRKCLLEGLDEIALSLAYEAEILAFENRESFPRITKGHEPILVS